MHNLVKLKGKCVHIFTEVNFLILDYTALYVFPEDLLEICVKVDWSLELVVVTVSHRKGNLNNWSNCSLLDVFLNVTVGCVSAWPRCLCVSVCVCWQSLLVIWQEEKGKISCLHFWG